MRRSSIRCVLPLVLLAGCRAAAPGTDARIAELEEESREQRRLLKTYEALLEPTFGIHGCWTHTPVGGKVTEVAQGQYVWIDQGQAQGVRVGWTFEVYRGRRSKGRVRVLHVSEGRSACVIERRYPGRSMSAGDDAATHI